MAAFVLVMHKAYPVLVQRGEFRGIPLREAVAWMVSPPSFVILLPVVALLFLLNVRQLRAMKLGGIAISAFIAAVLVAEVFFPYDLLHGIDWSWMNALLFYSLLAATMIAALLSPRLIARWLV